MESSINLFNLYEKYNENSVSIETNTLSNLKNNEIIQILKENNIKIFFGDDSLS